MRILSALPHPLLLLLLLSGLSCRPQSRPGVMASPASNDPRSTWPVPPDWKPETIAFPLEFAPDIRHRGVEELRFAPGFFTPQAPGYWPYASLWWLEERAPLDAIRLESELLRYFRGLTLAVAGKKFALAPARFRAQLTPAASAPDGAQVLTGDVDLYDAFGSGQPITLHLRIYQRACPASQHQAILFLASPQPHDASIWQELEARHSAFYCR